jgi:hypothetical protein
MFTAPLTINEYRILVDAKYRQGADHIKGWALRDKYGRIHGWHPYESGSPTWAHSDDAFRTFIPDTKQRRNLMLLGWEIAATTGIQDLTKLLHAGRGDPTTTEIGQP